MRTIEGLGLGEFGIWTSAFEFESAREMRALMPALEAQGWLALWIPESVGREAMSHAGFLLSCTDNMAVVNGIAQIGWRHAVATHGASLLLADAYPNRHLLGFGIGAYRPDVRPLKAMNGYLDALDELSASNSGPPTSTLRILAAYGPKMLELARDRSAGAHTYKVNVAHTRLARETLGPGPFLGVEHAVLFESDAREARAIAREHLDAFLRSPYNASKFLRLGYSADDLANGGSDQFVDDLVFWGEPDEIVLKLRAHLDAGADHVAVQVIGVQSGRSMLPYWRILSDALLSGRR